MTSEILACVKEEVTCPICLDLFIEPLSIGCGHSFCKACITLMYESKKNKAGQGTCPVCQASYQLENLQPNRHLTNIVERLKGVQLNPKQEKQKEYRCAHHGEKLQLFCTTDRLVICWLCERSQEHRGHKTLLLEEVAQEYKEKLQEILQKLRAEEKEFENRKDVIQKERTYWKNQIKGEQQNVKAVFTQLAQGLNSEEKNELQKLQQEEKYILDSLQESENELAKQKQLVRDLVSELEKRLQGSSMDIETLTPTTPKTFPKGQRREFQGFDLQVALKAFRVKVTLDPSTNPHTIIIDDQRRIKYNPQRQNDTLLSRGVLGSPAITSGKHYWEIDVSMKSDWLLGVSGRRCSQPTFSQHTQRTTAISMDFKAPVYKSAPSLFRASVNHPDYWDSPEYWVIGMKSGHTYNAFQGFSPFSGNFSMTFFVSVSPHRIGVFLDYGASMVSFYNITNNGALMCRFRDCRFPPEVFPYFNPMNCSQPMTVC
uniref:Tripartite motif-containing protein 12A n=1 Tax=Jaculus jaculus TaxID=51337 RepID=A0A8C5K8S5_JACJA